MDAARSHHRDGRLGQHDFGRLSPDQLMEYRTKQRAVTGQRPEATVIVVALRPSASIEARASILPGRLETTRLYHQATTKELQCLLRSRAADVTTR
jgi:hypothetical protein